MEKEGLVIRRGSHLSSYSKHLDSPVLVGSRGNDVGRNHHASPMALAASDPGKVRS